MQATRTWKNSSRLDAKMARNLTRSSRGVRGSSASWSTRRLKSSQASSRLIYSAGLRTSGGGFSIGGARRSSIMAGRYVGRVTEYEGRFSGRAAGVMDTGGGYILVISGQRSVRREQPTF